MMQACEEGVVGDWRKDLDSLFTASQAEEWQKTDDLEQHRKATVAFLTDVVLPAFRELRGELARHGRTATVSPSQVQPHTTLAQLEVTHNGRLEIEYGIEVQVSSRGAYPRTRITTVDVANGQRSTDVGALRGGAQDYDASTVTEDEIIASFMRDYTSLRRAVDRRPKE